MSPSRARCTRILDRGEYGRDVTEKAIRAEAGASTLGPPWTASARKKLIKRLDRRVYSSAVGRRPRGRRRRLKRQGVAVREGGRGGGGARRTDGRAPPEAARLRRDGAGGQRTASAGGCIRYTGDEDGGREGWARRAIWGRASSRAGRCDAAEGAAGRIRRRCCASSSVSSCTISTLGTLPIYDGRLEGGSSAGQGEGPRVVDDAELDSTWSRHCDGRAAGPSRRRTARSCPWPSRNMAEAGGRWWTGPGTSWEAETAEKVSEEDGAQGSG